MFSVAVQQRTALSNRPLVAVLDARDCSVEMPILKDVATVAFCDASVTSEIHDKVFNEAIAAMSWHNINLGREDLEKFKNLKLIVRIGSDLGNIDVNAASSLGIAVCITGAECIEEVADSTLCSILNLYRKTYFLAKISADLNKSLPLEGIKEAAAGTIRIRNSVLGLIGMGRVGMAVAVRAKAFGFRVVFFDPLIQSGIDKALGIEKAEALDALLKISDCISLHCPLNETTKHIINEETLKQVKRGCFIVNTSSGGLIHDRSLAGALNKGMVRGAALDCHSVEPYDPNTNILSSYQNVINTPNTAWYSDVGCTELRTAAAHEVRRSIQGRFPHDLENCVNKAEIVYFLMNKGNPTIRRNPTVAPYVNPNMPISAQTTPCAMTPTMNPMNEQLAAAALGMKFNPNKIPEQWRPNVNNMNAFRFPNQMLMGINQQQNANMSMIRNNFNQINNLVAANVSQHQMTSMAGSSNLSPIQSYQQPTLPISTAPLINNLLNTKMQVKSLPVSVLPTSNGISQGLVSENSISPNSEPANLINTHESALTEVIKIVESEVTKPETPPSCIVERSKVIDAQEQPNEQMLLSSSPLENIKTKSEAMDTEEPKENTQTSLNNENIEIKEWKEEAMENISDVSPDMNWSEHHNKSSESPGITNDAH
uniref:2-Hacid_dh_C domain-containing protein n=1 Tax=Rhabditophanes sp. KR3021 TaxID=114890 RepID=A0AC35U713_9BILA